MTRKNISNWTIKKREKVFSDKFLNLYKYQTINPAGGRGYFIVAKRDFDFSVVIPKISDKEILIIRQFRPAVERLVWELPMGSVDGVDPLEMAKTELRQETGYLAKKWRSLGSVYPAAGLLSQKGHIYLAEELSYVGDDPEPDEFIEIKKISLESFEEMIKKGEMVDAISIAAYYLFKIKGDA